MADQLPAIIPTGALATCSAAIWMGGALPRLKYC